MHACNSLYDINDGWCDSEEAFREEFKGQPTSVVRELHVYGSAVPVHVRDPTKFQHQVHTSYHSHRRMVYLACYNMVMIA
jgi:hypothetical protein